MKRFAAMALAMMMLIAPAGAEETDNTIEENVLLTEDGREVPDTQAQTDASPTSEPQQAAPAVTDPAIVGESVDPAAREDFINRIIALGKQKFDDAGGKAQRAHYAGDIYVCKNFTVYLFRQNRDAFRMNAYPDVTLVIPDNLPRAECKPYSYGVAWKEISAADGNPFYEAASFRYNTELSADENMALALAFMRQVRKGDYFQMSAKYRYGVGAHSAIMIADYDAAADSVHWLDSNMRGKKVGGIRYGYVQYDEVQPISWWAEAFCKKTYGATLYRLREDIVYAK